MRKYIRMRRVRVSYIQKAPDHGRAELAVVLPPEMGGKVVPVAYGEKATALWRNPLGEEEFLALARKERGWKGY